MALCALVEDSPELRKAGRTRTPLLRLRCTTLPHHGLGLKLCTVGDTGMHFYRQHGLTCIYYRFDLLDGMLDLFYNLKYYEIGDISQHSDLACLCIWKLKCFETVPFGDELLYGEPKNGMNRIWK